MPDAAFSLKLTDDALADDHALDLVGALIDLEDLGVAEELLHGILTAVAIAAQDLDGIQSVLHGDVAGIALGDGGLAA